LLSFDRLAAALAGALAQPCGLIILAHTSPSLSARQKRNALAYLRPVFDDFNYLASATSVVLIYFGSAVRQSRRRMHSLVAQPLLK